MKQVLSLLLLQVFLHTQAWALSGGPDYSQGRGAPVNSLIGTYSGVMIPEETPGGLPNASIGLFSVTIPATGLATGGAIVFANGAAFTGNMLAVGDPDKSTLDGIFAGTSNFEVITPEQTITTPNPTPGGDPITTIIAEVRSSVFAQGNVRTQIIPGVANAFSGGTAGTTRTVFTRTTTDVGTNDGARVVGTAQIDTFFSVDANGTPIPSSSTTFTVDGFKQSNTASTTTNDFSGFFFF